MLPSSQASAIATLSSNTVIDAQESYPSDFVTVVDGLQGSTLVRVLSGGAVSGVRVTGTSRINVEGGLIKDHVSLVDRSSFTMTDGTVTCTTLACLASDYESLLAARDASSLFIYGGDIESLSLHDASSVHFFGTELRVEHLNGSDSSTRLVRGTYSTGQAFAAAVFLHTDESSIVLHNTPEPDSMVSAICGLAVFGLTFRSKR
jgi:hypothetical protein